MSFSGITRLPCDGYLYWLCRARRGLVTCPVFTADGGSTPTAVRSEEITAVVERCFQEDVQPEAADVLPSISVIRSEAIDAHDVCDIVPEDLPLPDSCNEGDASPCQSGVDEDGDSGGGAASCCETVTPDGCDDEGRLHSRCMTPTLTDVSADAVQTGAPVSDEGVGSRSTDAGRPVMLDDVDREAGMVSACNAGNPTHDPDAPKDEALNQPIVI